MREFEIGSYFDETLGIKNHSMQIPLYISLAGRRKSLLRIDRISSNALMICFDFYGSVFDSSEWNQKGIRKEDYPEFEFFMKKLFYLFDYKVGCLAFENYIVGLFDCDAYYPCDFYLFENLNLQSVLKCCKEFEVILWNEKFQTLSVSPYPIEHVEPNGKLIKVGNFV
jgi:hypothetical protein